ncbi:MAG: hypothetical protein GF333_00715 [Candidatus Omnitrophica bacterium]|nr:hypothetical protein [Candidatus Omnitrophota bacterium]
MINLLTGTVVLLFGRKLFWLFVGVTGFIAGWQWGIRLFPEGSMPTLVLALILGIAGILLAVFFQWLAVGAAGFFGGVSLSLSAMNALTGTVSRGELFWSLAAGLAGLIVMVMVFDWALIVISSFVGAALCTESFPAADAYLLPLFIVFSVLGIAVQGGIYHYERHHPPQQCSSA